MSEYLKSTWVKVGLGLLVVGATPLLIIVVAADLGLLRDPDPNPVGPGILFGLTLWPAIICVGVGVIRVRSRRADALHYGGMAVYKVGILLLNLVPYIAINIVARHAS